MKPVLDPVTVALLLDKLTDAETDELCLYAGPGPENGDDIEGSLRTCARISEWLLRRFPEYGDEVNAAIRHLEKAASN